MNTEQINQLLSNSALHCSARRLGRHARRPLLQRSPWLRPCQLCWVQRIFMYPLAGVLAIGLLRRDPHLPYLVLPFSLIGLGVSTYHYLIQKTDIFGSTVVCQTGVPCSMAWINWFGFVTIPFLALTAFFLITVFSLVALTAGEPDPDAEPRFAWLPVAGIVAAVILVFGVMRLMHGASQPSSPSRASRHDPGASAYAHRHTQR